jgi:hypothetical protein
MQEALNAQGHEKAKKYGGRGKDVTLYSPLKFNRRFLGTYRLHIQGREISRAINQRESRWQAELSRWLIARLIFGP